MNEHVQLEIKDFVAIVTMRQPHTLNALDIEMLKGLINAAKKIKKDKSIRAVLLCGEGASFCSGLNFKKVIKKPWSLFWATLKYGMQTNLFQEASWCWRKLPVPVIAAIQGHCFGGGFQIALAADFRFATESCQFSIMEAKWGIIPDMTASVTLRELSGIDIAKELTMTGRIFNGLEAKQYGLILKACSDPVFEAHELIKAIKMRSPDSVAMTKKLFQLTWNAPVRKAFAIETWLQLKLLIGGNQKIAMKANLNKVPPSFLPRQ